MGWGGGGGGGGVMLGGVSLFCLLTVIDIPFPVFQSISRFYLTNDGQLRFEVIKLAPKMYYGARCFIL